MSAEWTEFDEPLRADEQRAAERMVRRAWADHDDREDADARAFLDGLAWRFRIAWAVLWTVGAVLVFGGAVLGWRLF